jgi:hypothetical protein
MTSKAVFLSFSSRFWIYPMATADGANFANY